MRVFPWVVLLVGACGGGEPEETCIPDLPAECGPLYEPVFDQVYTQTLDGSCALGGCHDASSAQGALSLEGQDQAWSALVEGGLVIPGDPACSELMHRLEGFHTDLMPPGAPLSASERCAIQRWIEDGAER